MNDFTIPKKQYTLVDEGTYLAEITDLEQSEGQFGTQVKFTFTLLEFEDEPVTLIGWTSGNYSEKSKLFGWNKAALGAKFNPDDAFQASKMKNKKVQLQVSRRIGTNGTEYNKVESVFAYRNPAPRKPEVIVEELGYEPEPPPVWDE
jgi:hypothetical protein